MQKSDLYWLAGLLEGEGCFSRTRSSPLVNLRMTDRDTVDRAAELMGAKVVPKKRDGNRKIAFEARIYGDKALDLMGLMKPLMMERRKSRIEDIEVWAVGRPGRPSKLNPQAVRVMRFIHGVGAKDQKQIAEAYGVCQQTVSNVVTRKLWVHVK